MKRKKNNLFENKRNILSNKVISIMAIAILLLLILSLLWFVYIQKGKFIDKINGKYFKVEDAKVISAVEVNKIKESGKTNLKLDLVNDVFIKIAGIKEGDNSIKEVTITNSTVIGDSKKEIKVYSPTESKSNIFDKNSENMLGQKIKYIPNKDENKVNLIFRISEISIKSTDILDGVDTNNFKILNKEEIKNSKFKIKFNLLIELNNNKKYETEVILDLPMEQLENQEKIENKINLENNKFIKK